MAVDGTYNFEMTTPRGTQTGTITFKCEGNKLTGNQKGARGEMPISGTVDGDTCKWQQTIQGPMGSITLGYSVKVVGDDLSGTVQLGQFGNAPIKGKRA